MKRFFQELNLARSLILVSLVGTLAVGGIAWKKKRELDVLRQNLEVDMPVIAKSLLGLSQQHSTLSRSLKGEGLAAQSNVETYIRSTALKDNVELGDIGDVRPSEYVPIKGIVDKKYSFTPKDKQKAFERLRLINFLYSLEDNSRRIKVTHVRIENADKKLKPHEMPDDRWTFEAEVTTRQRAEG